MKRLEAYADKRFKNLTRQLMSYARIQDPEVLHEIRVEIKKIKVILNLINFSLKKFHRHKHFVPFRTIFRQADKIREPDVLYELLLKCQIEGVTDAQLPDTRKINALSIAFQKKVPEFLALIKPERKQLSKLIREIKKEDIRSYLKQRKQELKHLLFPRFPKRALHKARKIAKEIIYLSPVASQHKPDAFCEKLEDIIGQWHDKQLLLPILKQSKRTVEMQQLMAMAKADLTTAKELTIRYYKK